MIAKEQVLVVTKKEEQYRLVREIFAGRQGSVSVIRAESAAEAREIVRRSLVDVLLLEPSSLRISGTMPPAREDRDAAAYNVSPIPASAPAREDRGAARIASPMPASAPACEDRGSGDVRRNLDFVRAYVFGHYAEPLTAGLLAGMISVTPEHLCRMFRLCEGIGFRAFLRNTRLERAAALLRGTDRPVRGIAGAVGFRDAAYFSGRFQEVYGMPPAVYRRECRKSAGAAAEESSIEDLHSVIAQSY